MFHDLAAWKRRGIEPPSTKHVLSGYGSKKQLKALG